LEKILPARPDYHVDMLARLQGERTDHGELPKTFDSKLVASIVITYLQGFFRVIGVMKNRRQMEVQIEQLLTGVGL
jgi:TetR/AcrR family transcriptional repressor of nem operon